MDSSFGTAQNQYKGVEYLQGYIVNSWILKNTSGNTGDTGVVAVNGWLNAQP